MKLLRYGETGYEKPGLMDNNGDIRDLSSVVGDITGEILEDEKLSELKDLDPTTLPLVNPDTRLGPTLIMQRKRVQTFRNTLSYL